MQNKNHVKLMKIQLLLKARIQNIDFAYKLVGISELRDDAKFGKSNQIICIIQLFETLSA